VIRQAALYLPTADDLHTALLPVAGQPVAFRVLVYAVRAGARSVGVPAVFRGTAVEAAIEASARIRTATVWLDRDRLADTATALVPVSSLTPPAALAALLATPPPAMLAAAAEDGAAIVVADARLTTALAPALSAGTPVGHEIGRALSSREATVVARGAWQVQVRDASTARRAEDHLFAALGSAIDTPLDRALHRRLSRPVTRTAIALGITPNQLSVGSLLVGLAAAWCFWVGPPVAAVVGLFVYVAAVVLDHADGEVARLTFAESRVGEWLDILVDTLVHATMVVAMGVAAERMAGAGTLLGVVGALGVVASAAVAKVWPATGGVDSVGAALERLGARDGFYAMLLLFIATRALAPGALPALMIVVALGSQAYWLTRAAYTLRARAGRRKTARRPK
jgi:phosphatidylglycerophosphate synthase